MASSASSSVERQENCQVLGASSGLVMFLIQRCPAWEALFRAGLVRPRQASFSVERGEIRKVSGLRGLAHHCEVPAQVGPRQASSSVEREENSCFRGPRSDSSCCSMSEASSGLVRPC